MIEDRSRTSNLVVMSIRGRRSARLLVSQTYTNATGGEKILTYQVIICRCGFPCEQPKEKFVLGTRYADLPGPAGRWLKGQVWELMNRILAVLKTMMHGSMADEERC